MKILIVLSFFIWTSYGYSQTTSTILVTDETGNRLSGAWVEILGNKKISTVNGKAVFQHDQRSIGTEQILFINHVGNPHLIMEKFWLKKEPKDNVFEYSITLGGVANQSQKINHFIKGKVIGEDLQPIEDAIVVLDIRNQHPQEFITRQNGVFYFEVPENVTLPFEYQLSFSKKNYTEIDTSLLATAESLLKSLMIETKKKNSSREIYGFVKSGSKRLSGVSVRAFGAVNKKYLYQLTESGSSEHDFMHKGRFYLETMESNLAQDTLQLTFTKENFKPVSIRINLEDLDASQIPFYVYLKHSNTIPDLGKNDIVAQFSIPITPRGWSGALSYSRRIGLMSERLSIGANVSIVKVQNNFVLNTFLSGSSFKNDTTYAFVFAGPLIKYWFINPSNRYFSSYAGSTFDFSFVNGNFLLSPVLGGRVFTSNSFAILFELKYIKFKYPGVEYEFNQYGNANEINKEFIHSQLFFNVGINLVM